MLGGRQMFGDDPFVLDGHLVPGEGDHPPAVVAVPSIQRKLFELGRGRGSTALRIAAVRRAARLGLIGRAVMGFPVHFGLLIRSAPAKGATAKALPLSPASRPRLSLAPESFAPSAAHLHERSG